MTTRSAEATIKGYYYQFDTSILKLLELKSGHESISIEGIEDIDINTATEKTAIQCKYLSKPKFINSAVREPIILMLDHFLSIGSQKKYNYVLYAHFENELQGNEPSIDLAKLKLILTYSENKVQKNYEIEKKISDTDLKAFLKNFKLTFGLEFYTQQKKVITKLKDNFNCSDFEANTLYYNNALRIVIDKAILKKPNQRVVTKNDFISSIDSKKLLFNEWFIKMRSKKEYLKSIKENLKTTKVLVPSKTKIILIGKNIIDANNAELPLISFIQNLADKYYKMNSSLRDAKPLSIILDCDEAKRLEVKKNLIDNHIDFNDGHEEIKYSNDFYNKEPIINTSGNAGNIVKSSYRLKLLSKETFESNFTNIKSPNAFLVFSKDSFPHAYSQGQFFDIKYCDNLKEVHEVLNQ
jgi:hypothetical protein